jgi:MbtH protein
MALRLKLRPIFIRCNGVDMNEKINMYKAVINDEEQYSILPADKSNPSGWHDANKAGTKDACLEFIRQAWVDMRPLSLRRQAE